MCHEDDKNQARDQDEHQEQTNKNSRTENNEWIIDTNILILKRFLTAFIRFISVTDCQTGENPPYAVTPVYTRCVPGSYQGECTRMVE
jgi:hypothetical protein